MDPKRNSKARFIVLEGTDGSGTTTQVERLGEWLRLAGHSVHTTREPTAGPVGRFLRSALRSELVDEDRAPVTLDWASMALLFAADRMDHGTRQIIPALERGEIVVSDRYDLSSLLYQSLTSPQGGSALPWLRSINSQVIRPDLTIVLDLPDQVAAARRAARGGEPELYERAELQKLLCQGYRNAPELLPNDHIVHVDAALTVAEVEKQIRKKVEDLLD
jgi:dTMP kinase